MDYQTANEIKNCFWQGSPQKACDVVENHLNDIDFDDDEEYIDDEERKRLNCDGDEFGENADHSPYYANGIIAIDACTAHSGQVNCLVIDD